MDKLYPPPEKEKNNPVATKNTALFALWNVFHDVAVLDIKSRADAVYDLGCDRFPFGEFSKGRRGNMGDAHEVCFL